jgi:hypothetical protein
MTRAVLLALALIVGIAGAADNSLARKDQLGQRGVSANRKQLPWNRGEWKRFETSTEGGAVRVYGLANQTTAIAWIHNTAHHWKNVFEKKDIPIINNTHVVLPNIPPGWHLAEWWDTYSGKVLRQEQITASQGNAKFTVTNLATDIAVRLEPAPGSGTR